MAVSKFLNQRAILSTGGGLLIGLFGVTTLFKNLIFADSPNVLWADNFDSRLVYWIANWGYHILFEQKHPLRFWNANSFFPNSLTLAYSESLLGMQLLFSPLRMLGVSPLKSLYMTLAGVCIIGALLTYHALGRLDYFSLGERILITFSAHFSLSVINFFIHYQLFGFQLAPPFFLFLYLYLQEFKQKDLFILVALFAIGISFAMYLAPMLLVLSLSMCLPIIIKQTKRLGIESFFQKVGILRIGFVIASMFILYLIQIRPYLQIADSFPKQSFEETAVYSANPVSLFTNFSIFSFWYGPTEYPAYGAWEYAYFPGFVLLVLGGLFLIWQVGSLVKNRMIWKEHSSVDRLQEIKQGDNRRIPGDFVLYMVILFLLAIILSWGPYYKPDHSIQFPFYYLSKFVFGLRNIRAPGRFGMFLGLPLAVFTVGFLRISMKAIKARHWLVFPVTFLIMVESFPNFPVYPFSADPEGVYKQVCLVIEPGTPLLEFPILGKDHFDTIRIVMEQLVGSTIHWGSLVVGYGAKTTSEYNALLKTDSKIQEELAAPLTAIKFGRRYGISHFLIHLNRYSPAIAQKWKSTAHNLEARVLFESQDVIFLSVKHKQIETMAEVKHNSCGP
jgi:hypothetical protein